MNSLRRLASQPGLRAVLLRPRVRSSIASILALRFLRVATLTTSPLRFAYNDLAGARHQIKTYALRSGGAVTLQHRRDIEAFHELYVGGEYEPPAELQSRLTDLRRIIDVGGNIGMFTHWAAARWPEARIVALEPAAENTKVFREWLRRSNVNAELIEACAMTHDGVMSVAGGSGSGTIFTESAPTGEQTVRGVDIFPHLKGADLVKMDIEGGEWPILADPRMASLDHLTLVIEYHRVGAPGLPASEAARDLLEKAGFTVGHDHPNYWGHGVLWAWKGEPRLG